MCTLLGAAETAKIAERDVVTRESVVIGRIISQ